jgi:hypothetical protein
LEFLNSTEINLRLRAMVSNRRRGNVLQSDDFQFFVSFTGQYRLKDGRESHNVIG